MAAGSDVIIPTDAPRYFVTDEALDSLPHMPAPHRKPRLGRKGLPCPHKGIPTGAKASYTREQYKSIRASFTGTYADRDRLLFAFDTSQGGRASEVCDLRWSDVLMPDGITFKPSVQYSGSRQKGGWPKPRGWSIDDFVFQSRKHNAFENSRGISRQQLWWVIKQTIKRAKLIDPTLMDASVSGDRMASRAL